MSKKTFIIPTLIKGSAEARVERGKLLTDLFTEFGMKDPKIYSTQSDITSISCEDNGIKACFIVSGFLSNAKLFFRADNTPYLRVAFAVNKNLDFEKHKESIMSVYRESLNHKRAAGEMANTALKLQEAIEPYTKQILFTATKFNIEAKAEVSHSDILVVISQHGSRAAVLTYSPELRFKSVEMLSDNKNIKGFDYGYYETKIAEMKNLEAFEVEISAQLSRPPVVADEAVVAPDDERYDVEEAYGFMPKEV